MKQCSRCNEWKDENEFYKRSRYKNGLSYWCRKCESEYARQRYNRDGRRLKKYFRYEERHRVVANVPEKRCRRCRKWKPESHFYKKRKHKDGLAVWCKECADKATNSCRRRRAAIRKAGQAESG
jgi:hypothetical protein